MKIIDCDLFTNWFSNYRDYIFIGGSRPTNPFPDFFHFQVYKNAIFKNSPDNLVPTVHKLGLPSMASFVLKAFWDDFQYKSIFNFNKEKNVSYFSRKMDFLEIRDNVAFYEVNLNMNNHIGKIVFQMENISEDNQFLHSKVFLPKLDLSYFDKENMFNIKYSQNIFGIGLQDSNDIFKESMDGFYYNSSFFLHVYIDLKKVLSIYVDRSVESQYMHSTA